MGDQLHQHECHCGTGRLTPHVTGEDGCVRFMTAAPVCEGETWHINGSLVTDYTLREQRGYHQHPCGCRSRWLGSINSIPDET
jgi:hypothetical protein